MSDQESEAWAVLADAAALVAQRSRRYTLDEVCAVLDVDAERMRERVDQLRETDGT